MFIRRRKNKSGTTSVVVVDKSSGKFRELKTIGVASDSSEIEVLEGKAREWLEHYTGQMSLDFDETEKVRSEYRKMLSNVDRTLLNMPQTILNRLYDRIGFNSIGDIILRHLVVARV